MECLIGLSQQGRLRRPKLTSKTSRRIKLVMLKATMRRPTRLAKNPILDIQRERRKVTKVDAVVRLVDKRRNRSRKPPRLQMEDLQLRVSPEASSTQKKNNKDAATDQAAAEAPKKAEGQRKQKKSVFGSI